MNQPKPPRPTFLRTLKTVAWGFLGLRKRSGHDDDAAKITPGHLILAGLLAGAIFVAVLIIIVSLVTA
jgi:hypothetical protein